MTTKQDSSRYMILRYESVRELEAVAIEYVAGGWVPCGGVIAEVDPDVRTVYMQTLWYPLGVSNVQ